MDYSPFEISVTITLKDQLQKLKEGEMNIFNRIDVYGLEPCDVKDYIGVLSSSLQLEGRVNIGFSRPSDDPEVKYLVENYKSFNFEKSEIRGVGKQCAIIFHKSKNKF
jgi:hypothetical protein